MCEIKDLKTSFEITKFCPRVQKDKCAGCDEFILSMRYKKMLKIAF